MLHGRAIKLVVINLWTPVNISWRRWVQSSIDDTAERAIHAPVIAERDSTPDVSYQLTVQASWHHELVSRCIWRVRSMCLRRCSCILEIVEQLVHVLEILMGSDQKGVGLESFHIYLFRGKWSVGSNPEGRYPTRPTAMSMPSTMAR